ncbi:LysR family transcriptional regulator [Zooshikella sp. RANM57]|uniref:LysR family transcriptional regulator n=1 Tax=Zooshikella sp. RANM57 TaxID=3425863 RepID=UPI003D6E0C8B
MLELRHLKTLLALYECGSLVAAAERLHVTQSALSHQIKDLEDKISGSLFVRKSRPLRLTTAGYKLLHLAQEVVPQVKAVERELGRLATGETGRLHIAIECHSCYQWLMPTLNQYRQHWPDVELDLASGFNFAPLPALCRADLDLVVTADPEPLDGISYIPLFRYESLLALPKEHPLTKKRFIEPQDLANETLIIYPVEQGRLDIFKQFLDLAGVEPKAIRTSELTLMMIQLIASGRGVCALPNWALTEYLEKAYITAKPLGKEGVWSTLYFAARDDQLNAPYMQDFILTAKDTCVETLQGITLLK